MLQIIYIHIPKTAGSSVLSLFRENFDDHEIVHVKRNLFNGNPDKDPSKLLLSSIKPSTKVLHGHFTSSELRLVMKRFPKAKMITFIRHPIDRVISNFTFFKKRILSGKAEPGQEHRIHESLMTYARLPNSRNRMHSFLGDLKAEDLFFIGLVEDFENDIKYLFQSLQLQVRTVPVVNKNNLINSSDLVVSDNEIAELKKLNQKDFQLYRNLIKKRRATP